MRLVAASAVICCQPQPSSLERRSEEREHALALEAEQRMLALPATKGGPPEVSKRVWEDLHWLPANIVGVTGAGDVNEFPIIHWIASNGASELPQCQALAGTLDAAYQIEWAEPPSGFVFVGRFTREAAEACVGAFASTVEGKVARVGSQTSVTLAGAETRVLWAKAAEHTVAIADTAERIERYAAPVADRLAGNAGLTSLLSRVDVRTRLWGASTKDFGRGLLGVASTGIVFMVELERENPRVRGQLTFTGADAAMQAASTAPSFSRDVEQTTGIALSSQTEVTSDGSLRFSIEVPPIFLDKLPQLTALIEQRVASFAATSER